ncbi:D-glycero-beta-D-manno-heptose 1,7-bisphosphate 7-phosphatase [Paucimonas lemoignei]|nr:D-glycero-beta-D-manno-heptose 1,7-bisphosphate 7-phosphatase [Paucimonas lemoignei]
MKLVILDRDGVINHDSDAFIKSPEEWLPITGSLEAIARLNQAGYHVIVASNQSGIARGLFDHVTLDAIHAKLHAMAESVGARIDNILFCPHGPDDACLCRKPKSGMFQQIAQTYGESLAGVPAVGDSLRDLQAGVAEGCTPYLVLTGKGKTTQAKGGLPPHTVVCADLAEAVDHILAMQPA